MTGGQPDGLWKLQFRHKTYINTITPPPFFLLIQLQEVSFIYLCGPFLYKIF
jgi:hypothetical protein